MKRARYPPSAPAPVCGVDLLTITSEVPIVRARPAVAPFRKLTLSHCDRLPPRSNHSHKLWPSCVLRAYTAPLLHPLLFACDSSTTCQRAPALPVNLHLQCRVPNHQTLPWRLRDLSSARSCRRMTKTTSMIWTRSSSASERLCQGTPTFSPHLHSIHTAIIPNKKPMRG